ncbi:HEPN domain-containing protein [Janibacter terrae]|uniref:HEPN domain-containing protein n=1 Tax=Janibacter terrae TaxID=103817 RepID=UPI0031FA0DFE
MARSFSRAEAIQAIDEMRDNLNSVLDDIDNQRRSGELSPEQQTYLNDYAVVRMAGYLEQLCFHAISGRIGELAQGHPQAFINSWFYKSPNLTARQFRELFKRFGPDVDGQVKVFLDSGFNRELLDNLLEIRNSVAHGKEYSRANRESLETFRQLVGEVETLVDVLLLKPSAVV